MLVILIQKSGIVPPSEIVNAMLKIARKCHNNVNGNRNQTEQGRSIPCLSLGRTRLQRMSDNVGVNVIRDLLNNTNGNAFDEIRV